MKGVESENGINLDKLESISHNKVGIFLKRKYSSMSTTRRKKTVSKHDQMEKELLQYIKDHQKKNRRVTSKTTFCKWIGVLPTFKGGIDFSTFLKDAKIGFILVSSQYIIYVISKFLEHQGNYCRDGRK